MLFKLYVYYKFLKDFFSNNFQHALSYYSEIKLLLSLICLHVSLLSFFKLVVKNRDAITARPLSYIFLQQFLFNIFYSLDMQSYGKHMFIQPSFTITLYPHRVVSRIARNLVKPTRTSLTAAKNGKEKKRNAKNLVNISIRPIVKFARQVAMRLLSVCLPSIYGRRLAKLREIVWLRACVYRVLAQFPAVENCQFYFSFPNS